MIHAQQYGMCIIGDTCADFKAYRSGKQELKICHVCLHSMDQTTDTGASYFQIKCISRFDCPHRHDLSMHKSASSSSRLLLHGALRGCSAICLWWFVGVVP